MSDPRDPELQALDDAFNSHGSTMHVDVYNARRDEILARAPKPKKAPASEDDEVVTRGMLKRVLRNAALALSDQISKAIAPFSKGSAALEERIKALESISQRVARLEVIAGALSMMRGAGGVDAVKYVGMIEAWEKRIEALEKRPRMSYQGTWTEGEQNLPGDVCTHDGSMWYCWTATKDRPGTSDAWQLCVKRGKDAR